MAVLDHSNVVSTAPSIEPVSVSDVRDQLRLTSTDEDSVLAGYITAAREQVEHDTRLSLLTQSRTLKLRRWPLGNCIPLPFPPLQSVTSVSYIDQNEASQTFSSGSYDVDTGRSAIFLGYNETWPTILDTENAVTVIYVAGYSAVASVPRRIKQAILLLVGHWQENRVPIVPGGMQSELPLAYSALVRSVAAGEYP